MWSSPTAVIHLFVYLLCTTVKHHISETLDLCVSGEAVGTEEQTAVTITGVPQAAFADHNVQYQFRTENSGGQVRTVKGNIQNISMHDIGKQASSHSI